MTTFREESTNRRRISAAGRLTIRGSGVMTGVGITTNGNERTAADGPSGPDRSVAVRSSAGTPGGSPSGPPARSGHGFVARWRSRRSRPDQRPDRHAAEEPRKTFGSPSEVVARSAAAARSRRARGSNLMSGASTGPGSPRSRRRRGRPMRPRPRSRDGSPRCGGCRCRAAPRAQSRPGAEHGGREQERELATPLPRRKTNSAVLNVPTRSARSVPDRWPSARV